MTTKKQKREAAEAKRAAFEEQVKADGLKAQKADQERRRKLNETLEALAPMFKAFVDKVVGENE